MQVHFVSVCRGKATPLTEYEIAYMRWRSSKPDIPKVLARAKAEKRANAENRKREAAAKQKRAAAAKRKRANVQELAYTQKPGSLSQRASRLSQHSPTGSEGRVYSPAGSEARVSGKESSLDMEALKAAEEKRLKAAKKFPKKDFKPRKIQEPWGSRDDWKRDTALNKYNGR